MTYGSLFSGIAETIVLAREITIDIKARQQRRHRADRIARKGRAA